MTENDQIKEKICKVLAMLEGAKTPGEAQAASLALQRLMARSGLTADEVEALDTDDVSIPILEEDACCCHCQ